MFKGYRVFVAENKKVWGIDRSDGYINTANVFIASELYTNEWLKGYISSNAYFTTIIKKKNITSGNSTNGVVTTGRPHAKNGTKHLPHTIYKN